MGPLCKLIEVVPAAISTNPTFVNFGILRRRCLNSVQADCSPFPDKGTVKADCQGEWTKLQVIVLPLKFMTFSKFKPAVEDEKIILTLAYCF